MFTLNHTLKEDRFDVEPPLYRRAPVSGEYFKQIEIIEFKLNPTLFLDNGALTTNTREFLTPLWGDLGMLQTPENITTSSALTHVVVKQLSQPITCLSNLNVGGYPTLTIKNFLHISKLSPNSLLVYPHQNMPNLRYASFFSACTKEHDRNQDRETQRT